TLPDRERVQCQLYRGGESRDNQRVRASMSLGSVSTRYSVKTRYNARCRYLGKTLTLWAPLLTLLVDLNQPISHEIPRIIALHKATPRAAHLVQTAGVAEEVTERERKCVGVLCGNNSSAHPLGVSEMTTRRQQHGCSVSHRFEHRHGQPFALRRK